ncbi:GNAT family N-acetyltransferase [Duganella levis]|uniref:GNAT family N-acetyltransferase n=1 Tax=Duganella levis TaxID=2692169 RepID=A0ABW9VZ77_9BURK|nr:GNAT family N-acetyltransferase [Duganella levis]MYN26971.1 hypothetical protein [Duganella levis]
MLKLWRLFRIYDERSTKKKIEGAKDSISVKARLTHIKQLRSIEIETSMNHYKSFTAPNPDIKATIYSSDQVVVGQVTYAVSPLFDKLYIFDITIHDAFRRQGFGLAVIAYLANTHRLPMATIKEVLSASGFWRAARLASGPIETLSLSEMDLERERWAHLKPLVDQLDSLISDRLSNKRESWEIAVGRGLPDWPSSKFTPLATADHWG